MEFLRKETQGIFQRKVFSVICNVISIGLPRWLGGKEFPCNAGDMGDTALIPGSGRSPGRGKWQSIPVFLPEKSHEQRSLVGYSPWACKELDMT